jgi:hypothetical protein
MVQQRSKSRSRSRNSKQLKGGNPYIVYPLITIAGLAALYYLKQKGSQLGERLEERGDRAFVELQGNAAALARRAGDDIIKKDREKLRLKIAQLHRELDPEDQLDDIDTRHWNCDLEGDPIYCMNEIIRELENISIAAEERKRLKREQEFKSDYASADVDESIIRDIFERKRRIEAGESPSDERSPFVNAAAQAVEANRTKLSRKERIKKKLTPKTRRGGRTNRKRNRRTRTRRSRRRTSCR